MNLLRLHTMLVTLLVLIPLAALWAGGEMNPVVSALVLVSLVVSWYWRPKRWTLKGRWRLDSLLIMLVLGITLGRLAVGGWLRIEPLVDLVLLIVAVKLLQRQTPRDTMQLMALSFLLLASASAFNQGLAFALAFVAYLVLATLCLVTQHFFQDLSQHHPAEVGRFQVERRLMGSLGGIALVVILFATLFFLTFPRMGFGLFNRAGRSGLMTSGFSEEVSLGQHGTIQDDQTIVMRVRLTRRDQRVVVEEPRWRGISYDHYDGRQWSRRLHSASHAWLSLDNIYLADGRVELDRDQTIVQEIYLEPLDTQVLFSLPGLLGVSFPEENPELPRSFWRERVEVTSTGDLYLRRARPSGVHYLAYSSGETGRWPVPDQADLRGYLQLPEGRSEAFEELARQIVQGATGDGDKAVRLERFLRERYQYTTDLPRILGDNPIEEFLFRTRRGHCEYFATAMVLLARQVGLPARIVNGFVGGDWNRFGGFYAVRQSHAHSWVEVWLPDRGWMTFDPTPPGALDARRGSGLWSSVLAAIDTLRMLWYEHVVDFDLERQLHAARSVVGLFATDQELMGDLVRLSFSAFRNTGALALQLLLWLAGVWIYGRRHRRRVRWSWVDLVIGAVWLVVVEVSLVLLWRPSVGAAQMLVFGLAVLGSMLVAWVVREGPGYRVSRRSVGGRPRAVSREYLRVVHWLVRQGYDHRPSDTPEQLIRQARRYQAPYLSGLTEVIALYQRYRFSGGDWEAHLGELRVRVAQLGRRIKQAGRMQPVAIQEGSRPGTALAGAGERREGGDHAG
ncbi:MAG: DUF3488 domain-containing protein [Bradymonadales bacterium]|nr:DUF3488 domain-containing protein [Bradymonadales bacterium]